MVLNAVKQPGIWRWPRAKSLQASKGYNSSAKKPDRFFHILLINLTRNSSTFRPLELNVQPLFLVYRFPSVNEREHMPDRLMFVFICCFRGREKCPQFVLLFTN